MEPWLPSLLAIALIAITALIAAIKKISITISLILANILVFFVYMLFEREITLGLAFNTLYLSPRGIPYLYTLLTSMFVHGDFLHLFGNLIVLFFVGMAFERKVGGKKFLLVYILTGICGALAFSMIHLGSKIFLVGASGAIFGILGAFAAAYPMEEVLMPIPIGIMIITRVKVIIAVIFFAIFETLLFFVSPYIEDHTAHLAHIGGLVSGIIISMLLIREPKVSVIESKVGTSKELESLAKTPEQLEIIDKIRHETIPDIRDLWIEKLLEIARCPRCGGDLSKRGNRIGCKSCRFEMRI